MRVKKQTGKKKSSWGLSLGGWIFYTTHLVPHFLLMLHSNLSLIGLAVSEEKMLEYYDNMLVYCLGCRADEALGSILAHLSH